MSYQQQVDVQISKLPRERTIYISEIDSNVPEQKIAMEFGKFGKIEIIQSKEITNGKSFFVVYVTKEGADSALKESQQIRINNKAARVTPYLEMTTLDQDANIFIEDLDSSYTTESLTQLLQKYGKILSARVQINKDQRSKGVAYIQFDTKEAADKCIADSDKHQLKIKRYKPNKQKLDKLERKNVYIGNIKFNGNLENLRQELTQHLAEYGQVELVVKQNTNTIFAFIKFPSQESAEKAMQSNKLFQDQRLQMNWVVNMNDHDIESNLFTKNLKATVTEKEIMEAFSTIVPVIKVQMMPYVPEVNIKTQRACINLPSSDHGKKVIAEALRKPEILALYEQGTVVITPVFSKQERNEFQKMKENSRNLYNSRFAQSSYNMYYQPQYQQHYQDMQSSYQQQPYGGQQYGGQQYGGPSYGGQQYNGGYRGQRRNNGPYQQRPYQNRNSNPNYQQNPRSQGAPHHQHHGNQNHQQTAQQQQPLSIPELEVLKQQNRLDQLRSILGNQLFPKVRQLAGEQRAPQVTGILLDFDEFTIAELVRLINDQAYLTENVQEALNLLNEQQK